MTIDLSTRYLGLALKHPIIASASPLTATVDGIRALEDAGAAAVVMPSLFEEQIRAEDTAYAMYTDRGSYSQSEAGSYFPEMAGYDTRIRASPRTSPSTSGYHILPA
jgi:dihydroorotate dehydrogenase (fumarate)